MKTCLLDQFSRLQVVPLASAQTYNSGTWCEFGYRVSNDSGNKTENMKRRHNEANQGSGGRKGPCTKCQFKRKSTEGGLHCVTDCRQVMTVLQPFVMNRLDICRQRTTSLLAITPEKDTHAQNRERVPLMGSGLTSGSVWVDVPSLIQKSAWNLRINEHITQLSFRLWQLIPVEFGSPFHASTCIQLKENSHQKPLSG